MPRTRLQCLHSRAPRTTDVNGESYQLRGLAQGDVENAKSGFVRVRGENVGVGQDSLTLRRISITSRMRCMGAIDAIEAGGNPEHALGARWQRGQSLLQAFSEWQKRGQGDHHNQKGYERDGCNLQQTRLGQYDGEPHGDQGIAGRGKPARHRPRSYKCL